MDEDFKFWKEWGNLLGSKAFANAFTAIGVLAANCRSIRSSVFKTRAVNTSGNILNMVYESMKGLMDYKQDMVNGPLTLTWKLPKPDDTIIIGFYKVSLRDLDPFQLSATWQIVADNINSLQFMPKLRLKVISNPNEGAISPWFKLLLDSAPSITYGSAGKSLYIRMKFPSSEIYMQWPVRLGFLPGNKAGESVMQARLNWPSNENTIEASIMRENDNCDILAYDGTLANLLDDVRNLPVPMKCNLIILRGPAEDHMADFLQNIRELTTLTRSNGLIFCSESMSDYDFSGSLNEIINQLSHNLHLDVCLSRAFRQPLTPSDPIIFLSDSLAGFRLEQLFDKMMLTVKKMPDEVKLKIQPETLQRLNINVKDVVVNPSNLKELLIKGRNDIHFMAESAGATGLAEINKEIQKAEFPLEEEVARRERFISARAYRELEGVFIEEKRALRAGTLSKFIVWIGPHDKGAAQNPGPFPIEKLSSQTEDWGLTVVLADPHHLRKPVIRKIRLPLKGKSTECEFNFTPTEPVDFEGRITVLHRGRIIQTALLKIPVIGSNDRMPRRDSLRIEDIIQVRNNLGDLEKRPQFDLAFLTNHSSDYRPYLTAVAENSAWLINLEACESITKEINTTLSKVALSTADYVTGFESAKGKELLKSLVISGCELYAAIIEEHLDRQVGMAEIVKKDYLQIVSTKNDVVIPFEFIYDFEVPDDEAELCPNWKQALQNGKCTGTCRKQGRDIICPLGFWGLRKVIERHNVTPELAKDNKEHFLQAEATSNRAELPVNGPVLFAASERVNGPDKEKVEKMSEKAFGAPPLLPENWQSWESLVVKNKPHLIIALTHTNGTGSKATLEIGNKTIKSIQVRSSHVRPDDTEGYPLVALLGCDTTGSAVDYSSYIQQFRRKGAGIVIGTVATVFGGHAAKVAGMLIEGFALKDQPAARLGEILRNVKRRAVADGLVMAMCVVAFGDADWKLVK